MSDWADDCQLYRGQLLTGKHQHWCSEWDGLPTDDTCYEWPCCDVAHRTLPRRLKRFVQRAGWQGRPTKTKRHFARRLNRIDGSARLERDMKLQGGPR
jgi:hypothetical protein